MAEELQRHQEMKEGHALELHVTLMIFRGENYPHPVLD
jgi:hypothetical protein